MNLTTRLITATHPLQFVPASAKTPKCMFAAVGQGSVAAVEALSALSA